MVSSSKAPTLLTQNILAVKEGEADSAAIQALLAALQSEEIKTFIETTYEGSVVTAF